MKFVLLSLVFGLSHLALASDQHYRCSKKDGSLSTDLARSVVVTVTGEKNGGEKVQAELEVSNPAGSGRPPNVHSYGIVTLKQIGSQPDYNSDIKASKADLLERHVSTFIVNVKLSAARTPLEAVVVGRGTGPRPVQSITLSNCPTIN